MTVPRWAMTMEEQATKQRALCIAIGEAVRRAVVDGLDPDRALIAVESAFRDEQEFAASRKRAARSY